MNKEKILVLENKELQILLMGRRGGKTTIRILDKILLRPHNANQLSKKLNLDYNTIIHHTTIMEEHEFITRIKFNKTYYFHPTKKLINNLNEYNIIKEYMKD